MNIKTQRHLSRLIFRYLRDQLNEEESRELERWRAASEAHELLFPDFVIAYPKILRQRV